ncbi:unnamed protein product [Staurois parvus]|uniref:Uncharacterized protein n=1 Tax=Staurois parvus TaxID=386267 RepID=A0ABN9AQQ2_9NEOB|nr:unnamed protein product [Staurois parvus]
MDTSLKEIWDRPVICVLRKGSWSSMLPMHLPQCHVTPLGIGVQGKLKDGLTWNSHVKQAYVRGALEPTTTLSLPHALNLMDATCSWSFHTRWSHKLLPSG